MCHVPHGLRKAAAAEIPVRQVERGEALDALAHELALAEVVLQPLGVGLRWPGVLLHRVPHKRTLRVPGRPTCPKSSPSEEMIGGS